MRNLNGLAWRNLMQRKLRTILSLVGVALGVALLVVRDTKSLPALLTVQVVGLAAESAQAGFLAEGFTSLNTLQNAAGLVGKIALMEVRAASQADLKAVNAALKDSLDASVGIMPSIKFDPSIIINFIVNIMLMMGGGIILLTAAYLVFNTFAMTLAERRADLGRLMA